MLKMEPESPNAMLNRQNFWRRHFKKKTVMKITCLNLCKEPLSMTNLSHRVDLLIFLNPKISGAITLSRTHLKHNCDQNIMTGVVVFSEKKKYFLQFCYGRI